MEIKYGLISADSHAGVPRDAFTSRMSAEKWGDKIPHVVPSDRDGYDTWLVYGKGGGPVANCPAFMPGKAVQPKNWDEVPVASYDPVERLKMLDADQVDAEVLFPNPPGHSFYAYGDADFERDVARAYNDLMAGMVAYSDRFWPLAILPWLSDPRDIVKEIERAVKGGHKGINGVASDQLPPIEDPHWDPVWDACQELGIAVHFHVNAYSPRAVWRRRWSGYTERQGHSATTSFCGVTPGQTIPHLIFTGLTERFPRLKFLFAENGVGGLTYAIAACDHEWETRQLWKHGLTTRPSEVVRRQMYTGWWYEVAGMKLADVLGIDNILWESDMPHITTYWPNSRENVDSVFDEINLSPVDRDKIRYQNALRFYQVQPTAVRIGQTAVSSAH
jgi:uncharacterized protein